MWARWSSVGSSAHRQRSSGSIDKHGEGHGGSWCVEFTVCDVCAGSKSEVLRTSATFVQSCNLSFSHFTASSEQAGFEFPG
jgi:hypothetical protein